MTELFTCADGEAHCGAHCWNNWQQWSKCHRPLLRGLTCDRLGERWRERVSQNRCHGLFAQRQVDTSCVTQDICWDTCYRDVPWGPCRADCTRSDWWFDKATGSRYRHRPPRHSGTCATASQLQKDFFPCYEQCVSCCGDPTTNGGECISECKSLGRRGQCWNQWSQWSCEGLGGRNCGRGALYRYRSSRCPGVATKKQDKWFSSCNPGCDAQACWGAWGLWGLCIKDGGLLSCSKGATRERGRGSINNCLGHQIQKQPCEAACGA